MEEIIVKISPDGSKVDMEAEGFNGDVCLKMAKELLDSLKGQADIGKKPEFHNVVGDQVHIG